MPITDVRVDVVEVPLRQPLDAAAGRWDSVRLGLITLCTAEGVEGLGELAGEGHGGLAQPTSDGRAAASADGYGTAVRRALADVLLGLDPEDQVALAEAQRAMRSRSEIGPAARAAASCAVADLQARSAGRSLVTWLAGGFASSGAIRPLVSPPAADVAVNGLLGIASPEVSAMRARGLVDAGFTCLKLKGGNEAHGVLSRRVAAVRDAVGPAVALRLDLNGSLDESSAAELLPELARYGLDYVEQPIPPWAGVEALARLRRSTRLAIAADEAVTDLAAARQLSEAGAVDAIVVKPARVGGLLEAARIIELAIATGTRVTIATFFESGVGVTVALHLAATLDGDTAHGLSTAGLLASDLLSRPLSITAGRLPVPVGAGLGIAVDHAAVERYRVEQEDRLA